MSQLHVQILHFTLHAQEKSSLNVDFLKKKMTTGLKEVTLFCIRKRGHNLVTPGVKVKVICHKHKRIVLLDFEINKVVSVVAALLIIAGTCL